MLFLGQLGIFAGEPSVNYSLSDPPNSFGRRRQVLYVIGTIVSLVGTGFLIGVRVPSFAYLDDAVTEPPKTSSSSS